MAKMKFPSKEESDQVMWAYFIGRVVELHGHEDFGCKGNRAKV